MSSVQQICLRWNNHLTNFPRMFDELRKNKDLVDVTLSCEGRKILAHKLVLSACSNYFQSLFSEIPCKHPVIFFRDVPYSELESVINYMYKGEVSVARDSLDTFLKTAESLQVKGLVMDQDGDDAIPAVKETVPMMTKPKPSSRVPEPSTPVSTQSHGVPKEQWSQNYSSHHKTSAAKEAIPASTQSTTFTAAPLPQPPTPQSVGASSSLHSHPDETEEDDDVIIEPDIKFEAMDQAGNDDCAKDGQMDTDMYITGDDPETFTHNDNSDRLAQEITSIMSNLSNSQSGMSPGPSTSMDMNLGASTSQSADPHSEGIYSTSSTKDWSEDDCNEYGASAITSVPIQNRYEGGYKVSKLYTSKRFLSLKEKLAIVEMVEKNKMMQRDVAHRFGVTPGTICKIVKNKRRWQQ